MSVVDVDRDLVLSQPGSREDVDTRVLYDVKFGFISCRPWEAGSGRKITVTTEAHIFVIVTRYRV